MKKQQKLPKAEKGRALEKKLITKLETRKDHIMKKEIRNRFGSAFDKFLDDPEFKKDYR